MPAGHYERGPVIPWTQEEYEIAWNHRHLKPSEVVPLIPGRSKKSVGNHVQIFKKLTAEDIAFLEENRTEMICKDIDEERGLYPATAVKYYRMRGLPHLHRPNSHRKEEIATLKKYAGKLKYREIADMLGVDEPRIRNLASKLGLETKFVYTKELQGEILQKLDEGQTIQEVAESIGKTEGSVKIMLRNNGYYDYLDKSMHSIYYTTGPEQYIMDKLSEAFGISFPEKSPDNRMYYWGIIPPYEVDIPFELNGHLFAIEYDGEWWHKDRKDMDNKKEAMLRAKGYNFFRLSSWMHKHGQFETFEPAVNVLIQSIENIIQTEKRSTTSKSIPELAQGRSE